MKDVEIKISYRSITAENLRFDELLLLAPSPVAGQIIMKFDDGRKQYGNQFYLFRDPDDEDLARILKAFMQQVREATNEQEE